MDFNLQVLEEEEEEESVSEDEADPEVFTNAPNSVPFLEEAEAPVEAGSSPSLAGALPSYLHGSKARTTKATHSSPSNT